MKNVSITDITLRLRGREAAAALGFKEKIDIVKALDRLQVNAIETAPLSGDKADILFLHTVAPLVGKRILTVPTGLDDASIEAAFEALRPAAHPRLDIQAPVSTVQMEYLCRKKPPLVLEAIGKAVAKAKSLGIETEVSLLDATRAERPFLASVLESVLAAGADVVTLCDSAGILLAGEMHAFVSGLLADVPGLSKTTLAVECSDALHMAGACAIACLSAGATQVKVATGAAGALPLRSFADIVRAKGRDLGLGCGLDMTACESLTATVEALLGRREAHGTAASAAPGHVPAHADEWSLSAKDSEADVAEAVRKLGYELSEDDLAKVFAEVRRIGERKDIGPKDLDAIVASAALQVPPTYALESFVITSGNLISSMATINLLRAGDAVRGSALGDGPIDAAFRSIENILGRHFDLDDFQIASVTEGREAVGSAVVRLLANGRLYSGKGVSTDIVGAAIRAYVNALNKICHEENGGAQ